MEQPYKVAFVLGGDYGSTGRIALAVRAALMEAGDETFFVARKIVSLQSGYLDYRDYHLSLQINRLTTKFNGLDGFKNKQFTNKAIKALDDFKPDLIYIHNLHGYYINFPMLFAYAAKRDIPVVWTLHDCWAFTGKCAYFTNVGCEKWKSGCHGVCPNKKTYPVSFFKPYESKMFSLKEEAYRNIKDLTIVCPSKWLSDLAKESVLCKHDIRVIPNGIDLSSFYPDSKADVFERFHLNPDQKLVLGVANPWSERKGLPDMLKLAKTLERENVQTLLLGTDTTIDVSPNIHCFSSTDDISLLRSAYSRADCLVLPTYDDNLPTVLIESLACGTPFVAYATGGCPEIGDKDTSIICGVGDQNALLNGVKQILSMPKPVDACVKRSRCFSSEKMALAYKDLFDEIIDRKRKEGQR